jgi:vacuolar protein sorting-associated protein 35
VSDSIEFILLNFVEMNKLWVRMQHQVRGDKDKRERERQELRVLVGTNLVRLRDLEGLTDDLYANVVLPKVLEQIINCKDQIAQQYLMDCLIQAVPDSSHLLTLEALLTACSQLHENVNITSIVMSLLDRLRNYATTSKELIPDDLKVFDTFTTHIAKIIQLRPNTQLVDVLQIQLALLNFALKCYPGNLAYVDQVLEFCAHVLHKMSQAGKQRLENPACVRLVVQLLTALLDLDDAKNQVLVILEFDNYPELMGYLQVNTRKTVAMAIVQSILKHQIALSDHDKVAKLFDFLRPLIKDDPEAPPEDTDKEDFEEEQHLVARLVHLFRHRDTDELFRIFALVRKHFGQGGTQRIAHTLPPLVFRCLDLARQVHAREQANEDLAVSSKKAFQFAHEIVSALAAEYPEVALRLFLQCAESADRCGFDTICYEFVTQAFILYEDEIAASKAQFTAMTLIIGSIQTLTSFSEENYDNLVTKASLYSSKLLKKPDQCRAVYMCSHLFWSPSETGYRNGKRVLECLQKSLKIADTCMAASLNVLLFVEILNQYIYYFASRNEMVTPKYLSSLIDLINTNMATMDDSEGSKAIRTLFRNTLSFIQSKKDSGAQGDAERYRDIALN